MRLKELDPGYLILLNTVTQKFEVHHEAAVGGTLECVLPYDELDERTIRHVRQHRIDERRGGSDARGLPLPPQ